MYIEILEKFFPDVDVDTTETIWGGWESDIIVVNKEFVIKTPKEANRFDCVYEKEKIVMDKVKPYISIEIPELKIHNFQDNTFITMDFINGQTLNKSNADISDEFVKFLKELHYIDAEIFKKDNLDAKNLPFFKYRLDLSNFNFNYDTLMVFLKKYNLDDDFQNSIRNFSSFEYKDEDDVICHNDLHMGNIMVDGEKISGIIDFGDAIFANYNMEFISIIKWRNNLSLEIVKKYQKQTGRKLDIHFILSIVKLAIYLKASYVNENDFEKHKTRLEYFTKVEELLLEENEDLYKEKLNNLQKYFENPYIQNAVKGQ